MANAIETQGFTFEIEDADMAATWLTVGEVTSFSGLDGTAAVIDVTHLTSTAKEKLMGLQDYGQFSLEANYLPADTGQDEMRLAKESRAIQNFRVTFSDASQITFSGFVLAATVSGGVDAKVDTSFTVEISGGITEA